MKNYIGKKQVKAEPLTLGLFIELTGRDPYNNSKGHEENEPGYIVQYQDGYKSWSPKEVFERAYHPVDTFLERMELEIWELDEKLIKLSEFLVSDKFNSVDGKSQKLLKMQKCFMQNYADILNIRNACPGEHLEQRLKFSFEFALLALKNGFKMRRYSWEKGDFLEDLSIIHRGEFYGEITGNVNIIKSGIGKENILWKPEPLDMYAEDWEFYSEENKNKDDGNDGCGITMTACSDNVMGEGDSCQCCQGKTEDDASGTH